MSEDSGRRNGDATPVASLTATVDRLALSYRAILLIFRLLIGVLLLLWAPYLELRGQLAGAIADCYGQALLALLYTTYCLLLFAVSDAHRRAQTVGSFIDVAVVTVLVWVSGGPQSPFTGLYLALTAITTFHYGLAIGLGHGVLSGLLWGLFSVGALEGIPAVQVGYACVSPLVTAFLCGMLRSERVPGILGAEHAGVVPHRLDEWLAAHILNCARPGEKTQGEEGNGLLEDHGVEALAAAGVRAAAVFSADSSSAEPLTLRWVHHAPDLEGEIGTLSIPRESVMGLGPGTSFVPPGSEVGQAATSFFPGWTKGQLAVLLVEPAGGPSILGLAVSIRPSFTASEAAILVRAGRHLLSGTST